jgi:GAF domain-containing protein
VPLRDHRPTSLATQISISTLGLVALSVLLASVLALGGVYNLARRESASRLQSFREILQEDLQTRFLVADLVVESAVANSASAQDEDEAREALFRLAASNTEYFDVMIVADQDGDVITSWPPAAAPESIGAQEYFERAPESQDRAYTWEEPVEEDTQGRVWVSQAVPGEDPAAAVVAARLRNDFIGLLVDEISSDEEGRAALVVDGQGRIVEAGVAGPSVDLGQAELDPDEDDEGVGILTVDHPTLGLMDGYWADIPAAEELGWRVVVLEPRDVALQHTQEALLPASLTVLVAAVISMWVAFLFGRRLAHPLRLLERRAREVASGAYIQPIEVEREDEVGRLANAFNAMAARLNALQDLSQLLTSSSELDQVLDSILSSMEHILGTGRAAIFLVGEDGNSLNLVKASGARVRNPELDVPVAGPSWVSQAFRTGRAVSFIMGPDDALADPVVGLFATEDASSGLAVPLTIGYRPFGVVLVVSSGRHRFSDAETEMARAFSAQAAIAVQNSRLFEEEHLSRTEAESLREMAELLAGPKGLEETLHEVGDIAAELLDMSGSHVTVFEADRDELGSGVPADLEKDRRYAEMWEGVEASHPDRGPAEPIPVEVGHLVKVVKGPLAGQVGVVQDIDSKGQARVMVGVLASRIAMEDLVGLGPRTSATPRSKSGR